MIHSVKCLWHINSAETSRTTTSIKAMNNVTNWTNSVITIHTFLQEAQLSLTNRAMLVCKVIEVWQDFLSEYVDKKFTYICYRRLIRHEWIYYGSKNCVITTVKKSKFSRTAAHIFVSLGDAPATITQYVALMERQFNACQTPRSMYLSIFNSFRVIRCLSQCVSPKWLFLPHFCFPWGRPWGNHTKCCINGKKIRCLQIVSLHVPI